MASTRRTTCTPTIIDPTNADTFTTFQEKEEMFYQKLFPSTTGEQEEERIETTTKEWQEVTMNEAREAIKSQGQHKAPGEDEIAAVAITQTWESIGEWITEAYDGMLKQGYHPKRWRKAIVAIIPKPNQSSYSSPKSYRPISLLATLGKGLEKIVAGRLTQIGEEEGGLHRDQWGGRRGRSAEVCIGHLIDQAQHAQQKGRKVSLMALDIAQAFPSVLREKLANTLRKSGTDERLVQWVRSFMTEREVVLKFDGKEGKWRRTENGIPQGSPVSPILFNMFVAPLLKHLEDVANKRAISAMCPTFIDDITIQVESETWEENQRERETMMEEAWEWAKQNGIQFEEDKFEWMRMGKQETKEVIELPSGKEKEEAEEAKILGVWIDREMKWGRHVKEKIAKAKRVGGLIRRLGKGGRGMGIENLRTMYLGTARATMEYGSHAWWNGQQGYANAMDKENERNLRKLGGHYRTAPGAAIMIEAGVLPTAIRLDSKGRKRTIKAITNEKSPENNMFKELIRKEEEGEEEWTQKTAKKSRKKRGLGKGIEEITRLGGRAEEIEKWAVVGVKEEEWEKRAREVEVIMGKDEERQQELKGREEEEGQVMVFVDGAWKEGKAGAGVWRKGKEPRGYQMGERMEARDAEMYAVMKGIEAGREWCGKENRRQLLVLSDSQEAIRRVQEREPKGGEQLAHKIRQQINLVTEQGVKVILEWTKAHSGIPGNERADQIAKEAREGKGKKEKKWTSIGFLKQEEERESQRQWNRWWEEQAESRKGKNYIGNPQTARRWKFPNNQRARHATISRMRTGHIDVGSYLYNIGKRATPECQCGDAKQNIQHVLTRCPLFSQIRAKQQKRFRQKNVNLTWLMYDEEGTEAAMEIWKEFVKERNRWEGREEQEEKEREEELDWGRGAMREEEEE